MAISNKKTRFLSFVILITILLGSLQEVCAQCQTCKANVETNLAAGGTMGLGINSGILYLLVMPYILIMTVGLAWYFTRRKKLKAEQQS